MHSTQQIRRSLTSITLLRENTRDAMSLEIFAKQGLPSSTIEAMSTEFGIISANAITDFEAFDIFANRCNFSDCLVSWDQGELNYQLIDKSIWYFGNEFSVMDMEICSADSARCNCQLAFAIWISSPLIKISPSRTTGKGTFLTVNSLGLS